jgi:hypothetical protein
MTARSGSDDSFATCAITQGTLLRLHMMFASDTSAAATWRTLAAQHGPPVIEVQKLAVRQGILGTGNGRNVARHQFVELLGKPAVERVGGPPEREDACQAAPGSKPGSETPARRNEGQHPDASGRRPCAARTWLSAAANRQPHKRFRRGGPSMATPGRLRPGRLRPGRLRPGRLRPGVGASGSVVWSAARVGTAGFRDYRLGKPDHVAVGRFRIDG